jgi:hypothetical protein
VYVQVVEKCLIGLSRYDQKRLGVVETKRHSHAKRDGLCANDDAHSFVSCASKNPEDA